jgi:peptidoglycan/xylan/chitin deacetylase (PgdA/CDA1 family)
MLLPWSFAMAGFLKRMVKTVFSSRTLIQYLCRLKKRPVVIVLAYHDIGENERCPSWLRLPPQRFDEQLHAFGCFCNFIAPNALFNRSALCRDRPNVLITFDDGYLGNLRVAAPLLAKYQVSAQFFVTTANMQAGELFWFDKIIIPIQSQAMEVLDLGHLGLAEYRFESNAYQDQRWSIVQRLLEDFKKLGQMDRDRVIEHFEKQFHDVIEEHFDEYRPLSAGELRILASNPLHVIGSHSHHHAILTELPPEKLSDYLIFSKSILEEITQLPITDIAFPNGNSNHCVRQQAASAGYRLAYGAFPGLVDSATDRYNIPRTLIGAFDDIPSILFKMTMQIIKHHFV